MRGYGHGPYFGEKKMSEQMEIFLAWCDHRHVVIWSREAFAFER